MYQQHFGLTQVPLGKTTAVLFDDGRIEHLRNRFQWLLFVLCAFFLSLTSIFSSDFGRNSTLASGPDIGEYYKQSDGRHG